MKKLVSILCVLMIILSGCNSTNVKEQLTTTSQVAETSETTTTSQSQAQQAQVTDNNTFLPSLHLPEELTQIINKNREDVFKPIDKEKVSEVIKGYQTPDLDPTTDTKIAEAVKEANSDTNTTVPETLTHEQILHELDYLFNLLKYGYGGYTYFGGDEVFNALKQTMQAKLATMSDPLSSDDYLNKLLIPFLKSVIVDNHFSIGSDKGGETIGKIKVFYSCEDLFFYKDGDIYTTIVDGKEYNLTNDTDKTNLVPSLDKDGKLAYIFGLMGNPSHITYPMTINLEDTQSKEAISKEIYLTAASYDYLKDLNTNTDVYTVSEISGITVLSNRTLYDRSLYDTDRIKHLNDFVNTGKTLRDKKLLILDLRRNLGGSPYYAPLWVNNYTDYTPSTPFIFTWLLTRTSKLLDGISNTLTKTGNIETSNTISKVNLFWSSTWTAINNYSPKKIPNNNLVIVLMDNLVASGGELFISYLRQMDNVIFVGTSTEGCLTVSGSSGDNKLPESRFHIYFGTALSIPSDLSQLESIGFAPDLWVSPGESLDRVIKFIEQYGLKP